MKRDMELVRSILTQREESSEPHLYFVGDEAGHVALLIDAGLVESSTMKSSNHGIVRAVIERLTWSGHEFVAAARSDTIWRKTKDTMLKKGIPLTFEVVKAMLFAETKQHLGLP